MTLYRYNDFGQMTSEIDPEGNVDTYSYFPEQDPDGDGTLSPMPADDCAVLPAPGCRTLDGSTGGYLASTVKDTVATRRTST